MNGEPVFLSTGHVFAEGSVKAVSALQGSGAGSGMVFYTFEVHGPGFKVVVDAGRCGLQSSEWNEVNKRALALQKEFAERLIVCPQGGR